MVRQISRFVCQNCGAEFPKWSGQCGSCGQWNNLVETIVATKTKRGFSQGGLGKTGEPIKFADVSKKKIERIKIGINEFDRVLGGGVVPGSVTLLAGEPGIGKSTLLTQLALVSPSVLYVCAEESPEQIRLRIDRLGYQPNVGQLFQGLLFLPETDVDVILGTIRTMAKKPDLVIVDSIQTMSTTDLSGMAGSVGQVRESAYRLLNLAKELGLSMFLVGHVTKQGSIAGPKVLEHLVDTVLYLEGDKKYQFRILRSQKNRFGSVDEVGVFIMTDAGLKEVANPSDVFLEEHQGGIPGSAVVATMEGTRPVLVEVQALVVPSQLAVPRRVGAGVDQRRLQLLVAVLSKRCHLPLGKMDVYVNVAGGLRLIEPAVDLGICLAIASNLKNQPLAKKIAVVGEVGLLGEVRKISFLEKRIKEAKKLGYSQIISPQQVKTLPEALKQLKPRLK